VNGRGEMTRSASRLPGAISWRTRWDVSDTCRSLFAMAFLLLLVACGGGEQGDPYELSRLSERKRGFPETEQAVASGGRTYRKHCALCHGDEGEGNGGSAPYLDPRPRDFTMGLFKFRSTLSGELPTDEDLFRVISRGVPGTAMPNWGEGAFKLSEEQRWEVAYYVKRLGGEDFEDEDFDPYREGAILPIPAPPEGGPDRVAAGREIFTDEKRGGCVKCHGPNGRGNGAEAGAQRDDWGDVILPADLTKSWRYKNGDSPRQIFRTLSTGLSGTPMPGYGEMLGEEERWNLAFFVRSLVIEPDASGNQVLVATRTTEAIPSDPSDERWFDQQALDVPMAGQVMYRPRHQNVGVDLVQVRALYDQSEIVFHFSWNDRSRDVEHRGTEGGEPPFSQDSPDLPSVAEIDDTFVPAKQLWKRRAGKFRDSLQLQFPATLKTGANKPFFFLGGKGGPVYLWRWLADREASGQERAFEERAQNGAVKTPTVQDADDQTLRGKSTYDDGRWALVMRRPLQTQGKKDIQFSAGSLVPFAVQVWDGGNGEEGLLCSLSSWYYVRLETPIPASAYLAGAAGVIIALLLVRLLVFLACRVHPEYILEQAASSAYVGEISGASEG